MDNKKFIRTEETKVVFTHYMPFDTKHGMKKTEAELLKEGYLISEIPEPEPVEGKIPEAHYTPEQGYYYEYVDAPPAPMPEEELQTRVAALEEQLATTQDALDAVLMGV